jgi:hypothetical protein
VKGEVMKVSKTFSIEYHALDAIVNYCKSQGMSVSYAVNDALKLWWAYKHNKILVVPIKEKGENSESTQDDNNRTDS